MTTPSSIRDDAFRLSESLASTSAPLVVVGRQWCFDQPVTLRTTHSQVMRSLSIKNETTRTKFAQIKHSLSATMFINPEMEPFATYQVYDGVEKTQVLTVQRESSSSTYEVHTGKLRAEDGVQPPLFAVTVKSATANDGTSPTRNVILFRQADTGEAYEAIVEGDCSHDRVALLRVRKVGAEQWAAVARIHRPKPKLLQAEYFTVEIAAGMDAMFVAMVWLARWGEFQREKHEQLNSHVAWESMLTTQKHVERTPAPTWSAQSSA